MGYMAICHICCKVTRALMGILEVWKFPLYKMHLDANVEDSESMQRRSIIESLYALVLIVYCLA